MRIPAGLRQWERDAAGAAWLAALPDLVAELAERWGLALEEPFDSPHSLVVPAGEAVLKVNAPAHFEAEFEAEALAHWDGRGAARLLAHDRERSALLLERCRPGTVLGDLDRPALEVIVGLVPRLWRPASDGHPFRSAQGEAARWAEELREEYGRGGAPFPRRLLDEAVEFLSDASRRSGGEVVANQDLHGGNVLRAEREPWLAIDPKPLVGEREIDGVGILRNAAARSGTQALALDLLTDLGLDRERLRGWGLAHALAWGFEDGRWNATSVAAAQAISEVS